MASIEVRELSDGSLRYRVRLRHDGRNVARPFTTEAGAKAFLALIDLHGAAVALGHLDRRTEASPTTRRTVAEQVEHHITHLTGITDGTRHTYRRLANAHLGSLGGSLLADLSADDVARWINAQDGAPKSIKNRHALLSDALSSAVKSGLIPANVAKGVRLPTATAREHHYLTREEMQILTDALPEHYRLFVLTLAGTGLRIGEASALAVKHVSKAGIRIDRAWKYAPGGAVLGPPKTRRSQRTVSAPPALLAMLLAHAKGHGRDDFLFTTPRGGHIARGTFHRDVWQPTMDAIKDKHGWRIRVHDLRHTYASWAIRTGTPLPVIQRQLGHETIQTTVDTYGHLVRADLDLLASAIEADLPTLDGSRQVEG